jgi:hypothetical protein
MPMPLSRLDAAGIGRVLGGITEQIGEHLHHRRDGRQRVAQFAGGSGAAQWRRIRMRPTSAAWPA